MFEKSNDPQWDIKFQERQIKEKLDYDIDNCERAIGLAKRVLSLKGSPGFEEMTQDLGSLEAKANMRLLEAKEPHELWRLQGRVNAFREIRLIMVKAEQRVEMLDNELKRLQNERSAILSPDGKVKTGDLNGLS